MGNPLHESLEVAKALDREGKPEEALRAYRTFLERNSGSIEGWVHFAELLIVVGSLDEAREACDRAFQLAPNNYFSLINIASLKMKQGDLKASKQFFQQAISLDPGRISGRIMFADCLAQAGNLELARAILEGVLNQDPGNSVALDRRNTLLVRQRDWTSLRRDMERQVGKYSGAEAEYVRSHLDLMFGDMPRGWERFEARLNIPGRITSQRGFSQPLWRGEPFIGKTLLLIWEQGFGDTLLFLRFAPLAKALGGKVIVEVQPQLFEMACTCGGIDSVIPHGQELPDFDCFASLLSLPSIFHATMDSIPNDVPYLHLPSYIPEREAIGKIIEPHADKTKIALCWSGNAKYPRDAKRSIPPGCLATLSKIQPATWFNFQFETTEVPPLPDLVSFGHLLKGFPNTAFALNQMDLVITVDTVLAHLAGALGIPTFVLLSFIPDWRWMLGQEKSYWYPTVHLFRQPLPGAWTPVLEQVVHDLVQHN